MKLFRPRQPKEQFPFLRPIAKRLRIDLGRLDNIEFVDADAGLMPRKGYSDLREDNDGLFGTRNDYCKFFAIQHGKVYALTFVRHRTLWSGRSCTIDTRTLDEELYQRNLEPEFIVECLRDCADPDGHVPHRWIVYKMNEIFSNSPAD